MSSQARSVDVASRLRRNLAIVLTVVLASSPLCEPISAQVSSVAPAGVQHLYINILEGEDALNNIRQRDAREPVVQVTDENHKPVAGVALLFLIHGGDTGGTATFGNGATSLATTTDAQGIAHATGLQVGQQPGSFTIAVTATLGVVVATAVIHQSNFIGPLNPSQQSNSSGGNSSSGGGNTGTTVAHHGIHFGKTTLITAGSVATAAAVIGIIFVVKGGDSTTLTLGGSTVTHP